MIFINTGLYVTLPLIIGLLGGLFIYSLAGTYKKALSNFIGVCMMLFLCLEYIPHIAGAYHYKGVLIGSLSAIVFFSVFERLLKNNLKGSNKKSPVIALLFGFTLHSIPTGLAVGIVSLTDVSLAIKYFKGMFFHHLSEGMAIAALLNRHDRERWKLTLGIISSVVALSSSFYFAAFIGTSYEVNSQTANWVAGISVGSLIYAFIHVFEK